MNKYNKESYITSHANPIWWEFHVNVETLRLFSNKIRGKVLDVGCNHGGTTYWLKNFNVTKVVGADINNDALKIANVLFDKYPVEYEFLHMDFTQQSIDVLFDTAICFHVLEHIYESDVDLFLKNIYNCLNKESYFIVGCPYDKAYQDSCHVSFFKEQDLVKIMKKVGFNIIDVFKEDRFDQKNILTGIFQK